MKRLLVLASFGLLLMLPASLPGGGLVSGTWKMTTLTPAGTSESTLLLVKLENIDGKTTANLVAVPPTKVKEPAKAPKAEIIGFTVKGDRVRFVLKTTTEQVFQGRVSKDGKKIMGVYGNEQIVNAAYMEPTQMTTIEAADVGRKLGIEQLDKAAQISAGVTQLMVKAQTAKDADEKADLKKQVDEATRKADEEVPKLFIEAVKMHPNTFAGGRASLTLLQRKTVKATPEELKNWAEIASRVAGDFGPIYSAEMNTQIASALLSRNSTELAVKYAKVAEQSLDDTCTTDLQVKVLESLLSAHKKSGQDAEAAPIVARLTKLEKILDDEFLAKVPPFKAKPFAGRKATSERAVVMELFTGAQCPPCVAADVAFDVLEKTYDPRDVVLIQYHMHIPGPDPMTNSDTEARWKYYRDAYGPKGVPGTPTTMFNGAVKAGGGGGMAQAEAKYDAYRNVIDPLLEEPTTCKVTTSAKRVGDKVEIQANVSGLEKPGKDIKLRLFVLEDTVRFTGVNKLRFHHQVVRAMPGGSDGVAVTEATFSTKNELDLKKLRSELVSYLDNYELKVRPFPQPGRPMEFNHLRVVAVVQDDITHEILQAAQVDVIH